MHVAYSILIILAAWRWGDWKNWRLYHPSMLFITAGGLLYEYLTKDQTMWKFHPDFLYNQTVTVVVYALVTMPLSVLIFLSLYPKTIGRKLIHFGLWIAIYASGEWVLLSMGRISYQNNWSLRYSILFDMMMFPMIRLHHTKPLIAYGLSIPIVVSLIYLFHIQLE
ncbi:CBO0543 family protein [Paenibacillus mucilaginosus]|uniref:Uncharacterized protein n=2 Tax=Paenibacillus mucilaginosus TaxID=61624 RepID=H6N9T0_9BACL|nr:CBO0543 family protein [Paenibacillus mucilaginosus]AFC28458.1 hypothetical protein PM3016_1535 [Paenibacillus mucilaginosus 3016]MCG7217409.1 hypothetical protein [Paenibacillus mucilaginosus]WDM29020.1 hypothetical protein KCX80_07595 [Paenibacillus mucilaginosus]WFA17256.1 hypothetical protein ERY13_08110 [Paenibacillus mucilaginosus]